MRPIRIAIIGYGKIAADQHVPSIEANDRLELVATSSRSGQGVDPVFTDWRELLDKVEGLEAVAITTPPSIALRDCARMHREGPARPARKAAGGDLERGRRARLPGRSPRAHLVRDLARSA